VKKTKQLSILAIALLVIPGVFATSFRDYFNVAQYIPEIFPESSSPSPAWWVNSGGGMNITNGFGHTLQGEQAKGSFLQKKYASQNPSETDNGYHPQNIFRLVTRSTWQNYRQQAYFRINRYILSNDSRRSESNGILLFNRYYDQYNLYYTGIRVDGYAVIKKKINGNYYTVASKKILPGTYNRNTNPNLIPVKRWIGVRADLNNTNGTVIVKLLTDLNATGKWTKTLQFIDTGTGGAPLTNAAAAGIRTDFMDADFENYSMATT